MVYVHPVQIVIDIPKALDSPGVFCKYIPESLAVWSALYGLCHVVLTSDSIICQVTCNKFLPMLKVLDNDLPTLHSLVVHTLDCRRGC